MCATHPRALLGIRHAITVAVTEAIVGRMNAPVLPSRFGPRLAFWLGLWAAFLLVGAMLWGAAVLTGAVGSAERFAADRFTLDEFKFNTNAIFEAYSIVLLMLVAVAMAINESLRVLIGRR